MPFLDITSNEDDDLTPRNDKGRSPIIDYQPKRKKMVNVDPEGSVSVDDPEEM